MITTTATPARSRAGTYQRRENNMRTIKEKPIPALIRYRNRDGKTIVKHFTDLGAAYEFIRRLDDRIEKGTCYGYILTRG